MINVVAMATDELTGMEFFKETVAVSNDAIRFEIQAHALWWHLSKVDSVDAIGFLHTWHNRWL